MLRRAAGVTLIELIVGIVVLAIAMNIIVSVLGPLSVKSVDPWHQVRAAELGQSLMNEIMGKAFDEQSSRSGSLLRCNESGAPACTLAANFGPEGESRAQFDDVDDFHLLDVSGAAINNILGNDSRMQDLYRGYRVQVQVSYHSAVSKRVVLTITTPTGAVIEFASLKGNW